MLPIPNRKKRKTSEGRKAVTQTYGPDLYDILHDVCDVYKQPMELVMSNSRKHELVICRRIYSYACSVLTDAPTRLIGAVINRERSNISHHRGSIKSCDSVNDPSFVLEMNEYTTKSKLWIQYNKTA